MTWTETGNINRERLPQKILQQALQETLGTGTHQRNSYTQNQNPIQTQTGQTQDPLTYGLKQTKELIQIWQKAAVEETKARTGLEKITVTRGMTITKTQAQTLNLKPSNPNDIQPQKIPSFKTATINSATPGPTINFATTNNPDQINIIAIYTIKLEQTLGLAGIGFNDEYGGEGDCPTGPLPPNTTYLITNTQTPEDQKQLEKAAEKEYQKRLTQNEPINTQIKIQIAQNPNDKNKSFQNTKSHQK